MLPPETARIRFRELTPDDASNLYSLNSDPEVIRYTGDDGFASLDDAKIFLDNYTEYKDHGFGRWAIELKTDNTFIGWCGLKYNEMEMIDLGYRLHRMYWGKGYATEAARICLNFGFEVLGLEEIIARVDPQNTASIHVIEKLGMSKFSVGKCGSIEQVDYYKVKKAEWLGELGKLR